MVGYIAKLQRCGKKNCKCLIGVLHGPYFWRVSYQGKRMGRKKYKWKYLGSTPDLARNALIHLDGLSPPEADSFLQIFDAKARELKKQINDVKKTKKTFRMEI
ncbi:MAG: hypothetical protein ACE5OZ_19690 [Candidatus Heimdallarchaeota archaeon]